MQGVGYQVFFSQLLEQRGKLSVAGIFHDGMFHESVNNGQNIIVQVLYNFCIILRTAWHWHSWYRRIKVLYYGHMFVFPSRWLTRPKWRSMIDLMLSYRGQGHSSRGWWSRQGLLPPRGSSIKWPLMLNGVDPASLVILLLQQPSLRLLSASKLKSSPRFGATILSCLHSLELFSR